MIATATARWFVGRACRHLIRIRIETTIRPVMPAPPPQPAIAIVQPEESAARGEPCQICLRNRALPYGRSCLVCQKGLPKYIYERLMKKNSNGGVPMSQVESLRPEVIAYQDAARNN
ncbi:MAG: hypothetical protein E6Q40_08800 [Cupriavidus sp.]|nr:MAG: hypothetical protein E6Q40_08800 [Cupriavidus sp.]